MMTKEKYRIHVRRAARTLIAVERTGVFGGTGIDIEAIENRGLNVVGVDAIIAHTNNLFVVEEFHDDEAKRLLSRGSIGFREVEKEAAKLCWYHDVMDERGVIVRQRERRVD